MESPMLVAPTAWASTHETVRLRIVTVYPNKGGLRNLISIRHAAVLAAHREQAVAVNDES
jgi:hypothetical protein